MYLTEKEILNGTYDKPDPQNAYGRSKLKGEQAVINSGANYAIIRTSWIVSSNGKNFLKTVLKMSENSKEIKIVDDQIGGPTSVKKIACAV